jgi:hypothetical protein
VSSSYTYHEVVLDERDLVRKTSLSRKCSGPLDLVAVVVHSNNLATSKGSNLSGWTTDTTAYVEDSVVVFDTNHVGKVMLMASQCLYQRFFWSKSTKMEGLSPAFAIQISRQVVVAALC